MKKFLITYNVRFTENGTDQTAETCTTLEVAEERMDELQTSGGGISTWLENLLDLTEFFKARHYIWCSVKSIEDITWRYPND